MLIAIVLDRPLAEAKALVDDPEGLATLSQILKRGQPTLGQLWTSHLSPQDTEDLRTANTVLPGLRAQFEAPQPHEVTQNTPVSHPCIQPVS